MLNADIVYGNCDEDALVEQLAKFLWNNRVELQRLHLGNITDGR
jgi:hypothetical protein